jgi:plasmid replication initiation protein
MGQIAYKKSDAYMPEDVNRPAGERWVTMNNALTRASHGLSLAEKRIVMAAVSKLDSTRLLPPGEVPTTRITAGEFSELYDVSLDTAYDQLQDAAKHLYSRSITFFEPAERRRGKLLEPTLTTMRWVGQVHYQKGEGWVELYWWPKLLPNLIGLKKQFTSYQLQQATALRSTYSWKLLELLMRFKLSGKAEYTIEDFCTSMGATEKQAANFAKIRTKMIEPAVKELVEKHGWEIQWRAIKAGRKVQGLRFDFLPSGMSSALLEKSVE